MPWNIFCQTSVCSVFLSFLTKCQTSFERLSQWLVWYIHLSILKTTSSLCFRDTDIKGHEMKDGSPWTPSPYTVFKIIMSARLCAASWNIVGDCDETFNYWEPVSVTVVIQEFNITCKQSILYGWLICGLSQKHLVQTSYTVSYNLLTFIHLQWNFYKCTPFEDEIYMA